MLSTRKVRTRSTLLNPVFGMAITLENLHVLKQEITSMTQDKVTISHEEERILG